MDFMTRAEKGTRILEEIKYWGKLLNHIERSNPDDLFVPTQIPGTIRLRQQYQRDIIEKLKQLIDIKRMEIKENFEGYAKTSTKA